MATRSTADAPDPAGAPAHPAPASARELIGAGQGADGPTDPDVARQALEVALAGAPEDPPEAGARQEGGASSRADRRRGARDRRPRKGGHKPTKDELERELKELRAQVEVARPEIVASIDQQAAALAPALSATFDIVFTMLARARGAHWKLGADEKALLGSVWAPPMAPYMAGAGPAIPWLTAALATWGVVEGRVELDHKHALPAAA